MFNKIPSYLLHKLYKFGFVTSVADNAANILVLNIITVTTV